MTTDFEAMRLALRQYRTELVKVIEQRDSLAAAARAVVWFDWSGNDDDAVMAIESLRAELAKVAP